MAIAAGMNIFTGNRTDGGLGAALTNPTELSQRKGSIARAYPVVFQGRTYPDAETCFQTLKASRKSGPVSDADLALLSVIMAHKLLQHPDLYDAIAQRGGVEWLQRCWHQTGAKTAAYQWWEGEGLRSPMIRCLVKGYALAQQRRNQSAGN